MPDNPTVTNHFDSYGLRGRRAILQGDFTGNKMREVLSSVSAELLRSPALLLATSLGLIRPLCWLRSSFLLLSSILLLSSYEPQQH